MGVRWTQVLGGLCLVSVLGASAFAGEYVAGRPVKVSGESILAPGCDSGPEIPGTLNFRNFEVEPAVAVNPTNPQNIVVAWQQDRWTWGGASGMVSASTTDGGKTWERSLIPNTTRCNGGIGYRGGDDWLAFAKNGDLYHSSLSFNPASPSYESALLVSKSTNGGKTWGDPIIIAQDSLPAVNDKPALTTDPNNSMNAYITWSKIEASETTYKMTPVFSKTTDGGRTWSNAQVIFDVANFEAAIANQIIVLPGGKLVLFTNYQGQIVVARSNDSGATWGPVQTVASVAVAYADDPATGEMVASGSDVFDVAVDPEDGSLYVVWADASFNGNPNIAMSKSTDGGRSWTAPQKISTTSAAAFIPSVSVNKDGVVGVSYYDVRSDTPDPAKYLTDRWFITSKNGGATWKENHLAGPFDLLSVPAPGQMHFLGDYMGRATLGKSFVAAYVVANDGNAANPDDVYISVIRKTDDD